MNAAENSSLHAPAEKPKRTNGQRLLDTVAIEPSLRNSDFGSRVAHAREDQKNNAGSFLRRVRKKNHGEQPGRGAHDNQREEKQDEPQENIGGSQLRNRFLFEKLVLLFSEVALAGPVLQQLVGTQSFFAGCTVDPHACLAKRRPIRTSITSIAIPVTTKYPSTAVSSLTPRKKTSLTPT